MVMKREQKSGKMDVFTMVERTIKHWDMIVDQD